MSRSERTCAGCGATVSLERARLELVHIVLVAEGEACRAVVDLGKRVEGAGLAGRGAWLHPRPECVRRAAPKGLSRSARRRVDISVRELEAAIADAARGRLAGLLATAARTRALVVGGDAVDHLVPRLCEPVPAGVREPASAGALPSSGSNPGSVGGSQCSAPLLLLAHDAAAAGRTDVVLRAAAAGRVLPFGDKATLGDLLGRADVAVVAVTSDLLVGPIRHAIGLIETFTQGPRAAAPGAAGPRTATGGNTPVDPPGTAADGVPRSARE